MRNCFIKSNVHFTAASGWLERLIDELRNLLPITRHPLNSFAVFKSHLETRKTRRTITRAAPSLRRQEIKYNFVDAGVSRRAMCLA
jgi:hypothetical protein